MRKALVIVGLIAVLLCVSLSGCNESKTLSAEASKFVGTWVYADTADGTTIQFSSDGTFVYGAAGHSGTWNVQDGSLQLVSGGESSTQTYSFSNNDMTLLIGQRETVGFTPGNYTKQ